MASSLRSRVKNAINVFMNRDPTPSSRSTGTSYNPDRRRSVGGNDKSIINAIMTRIAIDISSIDIKHCTLDDQGRYNGTKNSELNRCLTLSSNIDQSARAFMFDLVYSMLDEGVVAVVAVDKETKKNDSMTTPNFDVLNLRTGRIVGWYPDRVEIEVYNELTGNKERITELKNRVGIIENPFYTVMNKTNSIGKRLSRKLAIMDIIDEDTRNGKFNMIITLPHALNTNSKTERATKRIESIEQQLTRSKYGVVYLDATEHVTQLNRPLETNMLEQVDYLTNMYYSQLSITKEILDGTADEQVYINYTRQCLEPIIMAICDELTRKFLADKAAKNKERVMFFTNPLRLVTADKLANLSDVFSRNEIITKNEIRQQMGLPPSDDPRADMLLNSNMPHPDVADPMDPNSSDMEGEEYIEDEEYPEDEYIDEEYPDDVIYEE